MDSKEKVVAIESWQKSNMHPLTCGNCCRVLSPMVNSFDEVVLFCNNCGLIQSSVPRIVYQRYKEIKENKRESKRKEGNR